MNIPPSKWLVMALLTIVSFLLGCLPLIFTRYASKFSIPADSQHYKLLLTILSCFGAGVLFSTSFLHLLPEVRESFLDSPQVWETFDSHFPISEVVLICGFCLIYLVEEVAHFIMVDGHHHHQHRINTVARHNSIAHAVPIPNVLGNTTAVGGRRTSAMSLAPPAPVSISISKEETTDTISTSLSILEDQCPHDREDFSATLRTFLTLIALSFHEIMEGVAIGLQENTSVWIMFGAVASHKFVLSFCMGMELMASKAKLVTYLLSIIFFAIVTPIGVVIGGVLASSTETVVIAVIEGLVCGTLLYVVFFEILNRERERKNLGEMGNAKAVGFIQFVALAVGLIAMAFLTLSVGKHEHEHGNEEGDGHDHGEGEHESHEVFL